MLTCQAGRGWGGAQMASKPETGRSCWETEAAGRRVPRSEPQFCHPPALRPVYPCEPRFLRLKVAPPRRMTGGSEAGECQGLLSLPSSGLSHLAPRCWCHRIPVMVHHPDSLRGRSVGFPGCWGCTAVSLRGREPPSLRHTPSPGTAAPAIRQHRVQWPPSGTVLQDHPSSRAPNKPPAQTPWSLFLATPTCDKAPPSLAGARGPAVISRQTGNVHLCHRLTGSPALDSLATHVNHAALSWGVCWCPAGRCQGLGKDGGTSPSPAGEGAACTQGFMELGSVPCWAAPGQHLTPLACFLTCKTVAMGGRSFSVSEERPRSLSRRERLHRATLALLTFYRGAWRGLVTCPTSHSQVTPEPEALATAHPALLVATGPLGQPFGEHLPSVFSEESTDLPP